MSSRGLLFCLGSCGVGRVCFLQSYYRKANVPPEDRIVNSHDCPSTDATRVVSACASYIVVVCGAVRQNVAWFMSRLCALLVSVSKQLTFFIRNNTCRLSNRDTHSTVLLPALSASSCFPFSEGGIVGGGSESDEEREERSSVQSGRSGAGSQQGKDATRKLDCQNPLFHMPLRSDAQKEAELSIASTRSV